jgi:LacI family transcriptional regulator
MPETTNIAIVANLSSGYDHKAISGALAWARQQGRTKVFLWTRWHSAEAFAGDALSSAKRQVRRCNVRGIVADIWSLPMLRGLQALEVPVVDISGTWPQQEVASVHVDNAAIGCLAARHLLDKGFKSFGFWGARMPLHARERRDSFLAEVNRAGFGCSLYEETLLQYPASQKELRPALQWLKSLPKPAGVLCWYDPQAATAAYVCQDAGMRIPEEVALIGVDNDEMSQLFSPVPLTSVDSNPNKIGEKAMEVVCSMIRTGQRATHHVLLPPGNLVIRSSTDILAIGNPRTAQAMRFILNNADRPTSVNDVLREVPISRRHLENQFQAMFGRTPRQQIHHVHIERAKTLLEDYDLSVAETAELSGFKDQATFSRVFKRLVKCTPGEYRSQIGAKHPARQQ